MTGSTQQEIMEVGQLLFVFVQMLFSCTVTKSNNILSLLPSFSLFYFILNPTLLLPFVSPLGNFSKGQMFPFGGNLSDIVCCSLFVIIPLLAYILINFKRK